MSNFNNLNNMNFDENTVNKLKDMLNKGELNDVVSKISPEMIQSFSSMMNGQSNNNGGSNEGNGMNGGNVHNGANSGNGFNGSNGAGSGGFDFSQIDMNTILKMKSVMDNLNSKDDPRSNLLYSLKPYLREEKRGKVDQYANLLNVAKFADLFKDGNSGNKESPHNG